MLFFFRRFFFSPKRKSDKQKNKEHIMRLDKFLKVSRIIKRRTVANEAAGAGRISINGKVAKPASEVKPGDVLDILLGGRHMLVKVNATPEVVRKEEADGLYTVLPEA